MLRFDKYSMNDCLSSVQIGAEVELEKVIMLTEKTYNNAFEGPTMNAAMVESARLASLQSVVPGMKVSMKMRLSGNTSSFECVLHLGNIVDYCTRCAQTPVIMDVLYM